MKKVLIAILAVCTVATVAVGVLTGCGASDTSSVSSDIESTTTTDEINQSIDWREDTTVKYLNDDSVKSIICVQGTHDTFARVLMFQKSEENGKTAWTLTLECQALVGIDGLGQTTEENCYTPIGDYGIIEAFGIKENPGTKLKYVDVTDDTYCCGDKTAYNKIIDIDDYPHECKGEHMIEYTPEYNYGFFLDYNSECVEGQGSAIFFHCKGDEPATGACIAVDEDNMVKILKAIDKNTRVIIDYAQSEIPGY